MECPGQLLGGPDHPRSGDLDLWRHTDDGWMGGWQVQIHPGGGQENGDVPGDELLGGHSGVGSVQVVEDVVTAGDGEELLDVPEPATQGGVPPSR